MRWEIIDRYPCFQPLPGYVQLANYLERNKYLTKYQSCFRKFHHWLLNIDKGGLNGVIFFDLKKAFDTIDHDILLVKLSMYGVLENELKWFTSFLSVKKQFCYVNGIHSLFMEFLRDHVWDLFCS